MGLSNKIWALDQAVDALKSRFHYRLYLDALNEDIGTYSSGNWGHTGKKGQIGGSDPGGGAKNRGSKLKDGTYSSVAKKRKQEEAQQRKEKKQADKPVSRYKSREEYDAVRAEAKKQYDDACKKLDAQFQDFQSKCSSEEIKAYNSWVMANRRLPVLGGTEKDKTEAEVDILYRKNKESIDRINKEVEEYAGKKQKVLEEYAKTFEPDYEYKKIEGEFKPEVDDQQEIVNPKKLKYNCQKCAIAVEMRKRGYDVQVSSGEKDGLAQEDRMLLGFKGAESRERIGDIRSQVATIKDAMKEWGHGSRAFLFMYGVAGDGHVVNMENMNGTIVMTDAQVDMQYTYNTESGTGTIRIKRNGQLLGADFDDPAVADQKVTFGCGKSVGGIKIVRVDNVEVNGGIDEYIVQRG